MRLADCVIDIPTISLTSTYTYEIPETCRDVSVGCAVELSFGHRPCVGFVTRVFDGEPPQAVKPLRRVLSSPFFTEAGARCAFWMAQRYVCPLISAIRLFVPQGGVGKFKRTDAGYWTYEAPKVGEIEIRWVRPGPAFDGFVPRKGSHRQIAILEALVAGELSVRELSYMLGDVGASLASLTRAGAVEIVSRRYMRGTARSQGSGGNGIAFASGGASSSSISQEAQQRPDRLTAGQESALLAVEEAIRSASGEVILLDGVTGSGKTEVYLRAIESVTACGKTAIVLVPEISLTPQTLARFRGRFGDRVALIHSRMSAGERYDQWDLIREGRADIVVGARSALFVPLQNLGLIVIDEEHESTYKQESAPRYVSRDVAQFMVKQAGATLILGSATPSIEALMSVDKEENWKCAHLSQRVNSRPLPDIEIIDMAGGGRSASGFSGNGSPGKDSSTASSGNTIFSPKLREAICTEVEKGHKVVLLLNRRGFARFLLCTDCGFVPECNMCSTTLTYHSSTGRLVCHYCGHALPVPAVCPNCGSPYMKMFGYGTERVEEELKAFLTVPIIRMDADTTSRIGSHERLLGEFRDADCAVLLGTQMVAKGLDFEDVTLVGVINADTELHLPDFRAAERTFDLIEQVAGRAGRARLPGKVYIQTYQPDSVAIRAAAAYDRPMFLKNELPKRRVLGFPPYMRLVNILGWGKVDGRVRAEVESLHAIFKEAARQSGVDVLEPTPCAFGRIRGNYRWHFVVKINPDTEIGDFVFDCMKKYHGCKDVNVAADVDPYSLL